MDFDSHKHKTHLHVTSTGAITIRLPDLTTKYKHWIGKPITLEIDPSIEGSADLTVEYVAPGDSGATTLINRVRRGVSAFSAMVNKWTAIHNETS